MIIGEKTVTVDEYPIFEIFSKMNQMTDYFPSDDYEGDSNNFDNSVWNWTKLYCNDIRKYKNGHDYFVAENMLKISDALMPRAIEGTATLLYYFNKILWDKYENGEITQKNTINIDFLNKNNYNILKEVL